MSSAIAPPAGTVKLEALSAPLIPLEKLVPSKTNPRKVFPAPDLAEFAASIKKHGVIQALLARTHPTKSGHFEIVCGERRWRAAKEAGLTEVPVDVRTLADEEVLEIQLVENLNRRDLSAMEEADGYNFLLTRKYTHERIAEKIGRSVQYVRDRCRLLKLVKGAQELLRAGRIEVGHAILLSRLDPENQVRIIREPVDGEGYNGHECALWQRQRALPKTSEELAQESGDLDELDKEETAEGLKAVSVLELKAWIDKHVKLRTDAPETAELFPDAARVASLATPTDDSGAKAIKVIHITFEHQLADEVKKVDGPRVYGPRSWVRADGNAGSKACASSLPGIVVAGPARGEAFNVCIDKKKCQVHYKAEIAAAKKRETAVDKSGKTGEDRAALQRAKEAADRKKAEEAFERFKRAIPAIQLALAEASKTAPLAKLQADIVKALGWNAANGMKVVAKLLPAPKGVEAWVRFVAAAAILGPSTDWHPHKAGVSAAAKPYGVDVEKIIASANANEAASKEARASKKPKKPAKKKAGK